MSVAVPILHVALLHPKIPQNTGNIGRLCCAMGVRLHLVEPLGFSTDSHACRRAGLDYWPYLDWRRHEDAAALAADLPAGSRTYVFSTRAGRSYTDVSFRAGDCLLFGDEVNGLPAEVVAAAGERALRIPQREARVRSLNLANAVSMALGEALRQLGYPDAVAAGAPLRSEVPEERGAPPAGAPREEHACRPS